MDTLRTIWDVTTGGVGEIFAQILYTVVLVPLSWLLGAVAYFVNALIEPAPIVTSSVVQIGWTITRDFANSLFILILLGIALDFILFNSFQVKKMLPRLLLVALLINFSLPIAGIVLDFANVFTSFFLERVSNGCLPGDGQECSFTQQIAKTLALNRALDGYGTDDFLNVVEAGTGVLRNTVFAIFFIAGTLFIFLALGLMFLVRTGYLYVLLIILPIVLVLWAFPPTGGYFGRWTHRFIQWAMFAPAATFFIYLSLLVFEGNAVQDFQAATSGTTAAATMQTSSGATALIGFSASAQTPPAASESAVQNFFQVIYMYIAVWVLMLGSLFVAQAMGVKTAGAALSTLSRTNKWARGKLWQYTKRGADRPFVTKGLEKGAELAAKAPIVGGFAARALGGAATKIQRAKLEAAELSKGEKDLAETGSDDVVTSLIQGYSKGTPDQRKKAAKLAALAVKKGKLKVKRDGVVDKEATRELKKTLREAAYSIGDRDTVKAIEASDLSIARAAIEEKYKKLRDDKKHVRVIDGQETVIDPDTGRSVDESEKEKKKELYRKINLRKEDWDDDAIDETVFKEMIELQTLNKEHFKAAQQTGNEAIVEHMQKYLTSTNEEDVRHRDQHLLARDKNKALRNYLSSTSALEVIEMDKDSLLKAGIIVKKKKGGKGEGDEEEEGESLIEPATRWTDVNKYKK